MTGRLSVVATPIGNLGDLSPRAAEALAHAEVIACEDTRRTRKLLSHLHIGVGGVSSGVGGGFGGGPKLMASHAHNERGQAVRIVELVAAGRHVVLVSDAGMPGVSDPGGAVVDAVLAAGLAVEVIPGPSAVITALVASGMTADRFCMEGFLPRKGPDRRARLAAIAADPRPTVVFESPLRVAATLADLMSVCGPDRRAAVCRELTKLHEETERGTLDELCAHWEQARKGEHVIVIAGSHADDEVPPDDEAVAAAVAAHRRQGLSRRDAASAAAEELSVPKRRAYELGE